MTHVENVPELAKSQGQECDRHRCLLIQPKSVSQGKRSERRGGQRGAVQHDREPLDPAKNRILRIARRTLQNVPVTLAHGEGKGWKDVRNKVQEQDLQRKKRQWQPRDHCNADDRNLTDCLLYTSDAADEEDSVDLAGRRI